jgi:hypothetical protein
MLSAAARALNGNTSGANPSSLIGCVLYYYVWITILPKLRGYRIRQETLVLENGAQSHRLIKVPVAEIEHWDATHDAVGRPLTRTNESGSDHHGDGEKVGVVARTGGLER